MTSGTGSLNSRTHPMIHLHRKKTGREDFHFRKSSEPSFLFTALPFQCITFKNALPTFLGSPPSGGYDNNSNDNRYSVGKQKPFGEDSLNNCDVIGKP